MVGGLGLGYTAEAVLADDRVRGLVVVDALAPVISWHRQELVPLGRTLTTDPRCRLQLGDFFAMSRESGFDPDTPDRRFDAVLVDIDHSPRHQLDAGNDRLLHRRRCPTPGRAADPWRRLRPLVQ